MSGIRRGSTTVPVIAIDAFVGHRQIRAALQQFVHHQHFEAFLDALSDHLPGQRGTRTRASILNFWHVVFTWADQPWRSVHSPTPDLASDCLAHLATAFTPITAMNHLSSLYHPYTAPRPPDVRARVNALAVATSDE